MSERNVVHEALERFGRSAGLEKNSGAWYFQGADVIAVLDLEKSQYGPQYYVNLGFWLRQLEDVRYPKSFKCHVRVRLETLVLAERHRIAQLLDLEQEIPDEERIQQLAALLNEHVLAVIKRGSSFLGLREMVEDATLATAAIRGNAQQALAAAGQRH